MRYLLLLCFLFFSSLSHAILPSESTETSIPTAKEETKSKKEIRKQHKINKKADKKKKIQLKKQTQKLKWQLLKNAFKTHKANKKLTKKNKKDRKPVYWASWLSVIAAILSSIFFGIGAATSGAYILGFLFAFPFGIANIILVIKSIRFIRKHPKSENNTYHRTWSIIFTVLGIYFGLPFLFLLLSRLISAFIIIQ